MHEVLVNRLGGLSLPRKSVVRLTDRPDMTLDVYRGRKTTIQYNTMCMVYTGYCGTSEIEHGLCTYMVNNSLAKARGLSLRTGAQIMLYLSHIPLHPTINFATEKKKIA